MKRCHGWLSIFLMSSLVTACGSRANSNNNLSATAAFGSYEIAVPTPSYCDPSSTPGCAHIYVDNSAVNTSFAYKDLLLECKRKDGASQINITNSTTIPTLSISINVTTPPTAAGTGIFLCAGPTYDASRSPSIVLNPEYCAVSVINHGKMFTATDHFPCSVNITTVSPLRGSIECDGIEQDGVLLSLNEPSQFYCKED